MFSMHKIADDLCGWYNSVQFTPILGVNETNKKALENLEKNI